MERGKNFFHMLLAVTLLVISLISPLEVKADASNKPENPNVFEDFEQGMDVSKLTSKAVGLRLYFPRYQAIEEYNGNQVLMFRNVVPAYVGTLYEYANFEMTFDIPYIATEPVYENGKMKTPGQENFAVSFGGEQADWDAEGWSTAQETVVFGKDAVYSYNNEELRGEYSEDYFADKNGGFSVKLTVVDGIVTAGIKWTEEAEYHTVLNYKLAGGTPTGYIHIWTTNEAQFAVDNICIENKDKNPKIIETEFISGKWEQPEDAVYEPMERIYLDTENKAEISWGMIVLVIAAVGGVLLAVSVVVVRRRGNKKKGAKVDEK